MSPDRVASGDDGTDPLRVDLIGANQRLHDTLAMVFRGPAKGRCVIATGTDAQAVIVNLDGVGAEADWTRYRERFPQRPAIVLALDEKPVEHAAAVVAKPVRIDRFLAAIEQVLTQIEAAGSTPVTRHSASASSVRDTPKPASPAVAPAPKSVSADARPLAPAPSTTEEDRTQTLGERKSAPERWERVCGNAPDGDLEDPLLAASRRYSGSTRLLDCVRGAIGTSRSDGRPVDIRLRETAIVTIHGDRGVAECSLSDDQLSALCGTTIGDALIDSGPAGTGTAAPGTPPVAIDALLWKLALWTYRGQIPAGTALDQRMYLSHWPNLTRLMPLPNATRIAALLVRHPMRLARVAEALAIPQRHVFAFFVAASTIGLMGVARREVDHLVEQTPPEPHSRRSLLERIARNLPRDIVPGGGDAP